MTVYRMWFEASFSELLFFFFVYACFLFSSKKWSLNFDNFVVVVVEWWWSTINNGKGEFLWNHQHKLFSFIITDLSLNQKGFVNDSSSCVCVCVFVFNVYAYESCTLLLIQRKCCYCFYCLCVVGCFGLAFGQLPENEQNIQIIEDDYELF